MTRATRQIRANRARSFAPPNGLATGRLQQGPIHRGNRSNLVGVPSQEGGRSVDRQRRPIPSRMPVACHFPQLRGPSQRRINCEGSSSGQI
jgi:hypothetical protein